MLVLRVYDVMGRMVVEVSCVGHDHTQGSGHMVYREEQHSPGPHLYEVLDGVVDALERARRLALHGDLEETDDCGLV